MNICLRKISRNIVLGITGGIAAYKAPSIVAALVSIGHKVRVVVTPSALNFVTEMALSTMSKNKVVKSLDDELDGVVTHIEMADWADIFAVVPATANTISKMAYGMADNALLAVALAVKTETARVVCPAMNNRLWTHPATMFNLEILKQKYMYQVLEPATGMLACGKKGKGKLPGTREVVELLDLPLTGHEGCRGHL